MIATIPEAIREWAWNVGGDPRNIDSQWLLSDYDTWTINPHYRGPNQRHPEDYSHYPEYWSDGSPVLDEH